MFFHVFQRAVELAKASRSQDAWLLLTPSERSAAIALELRGLEAQAAKDGNAAALEPRPRRRSLREHRW